MRAYEQSQRAQNHYKRILSAKSSIPSNPNRRYQKSNNKLYQTSMHTTTPMQDYQYRTNNFKLAMKLKQIYSNDKNSLGICISNNLKDKKKKRKNNKGSSSRDYYRSKDEHSLIVRRSLINPVKARESYNSICEENKKMFQRIIAVKSTIEGLPERQRKLDQYNRQISKRSSISQSNRQAQLSFQKFRRQLIKSAKKSKKKKRRTLKPSTRISQQSSLQLQQLI